MGIHDIREESRSKRDSKLKEWVDTNLSLFNEIRVIKGELVFDKTTTYCASIYYK